MACQPSCLRSRSRAHGQTQSGQVVKVSAEAALSQSAPHGLVTEVACKQLTFLRVAQELFRHHPFRDVRLCGVDHTDAFPICGGEATGVWRSWNKGSKSAQGICGDVLAAPLFDLLTPSISLCGIHRTGDNVGYPDALSAYLALSDACVRLGRRAAGLPPTR